MGGFVRLGLGQATGPQGNPAPWRIEVGVQPRPDGVGGKGGQAHSPGPAVVNSHPVHLPPSPMPSRPVVLRSHPIADEETEGPRACQGQAAGRAIRHSLPLTLVSFKMGGGPRNPRIPLQATQLGGEVMGQQRSLQPDPRGHRVGLLEDSVCRLDFGRPGTKLPCLQMIFPQSIPLSSPLFFLEVLPEV